jgi:ApaG protein
LIRIAFVSIKYRSENLNLIIIVILAFMESAITNGIEVSVETYFQDEISDVRSSHYVFAYRITITNSTSQVVQLMRRHWNIIEGDGQRSSVNGDGVVGEQPLIEPGSAYSYVSGCNLNSEIGKMYGTYKMRNPIDGNEFSVLIPAFFMIAPWLNN